MNKKKLTGIGLRHGRKFTILLSAATLIYGCQKNNVNHNDLKDFQVVNLVANNEEYHPKTVDRTLINAFGLAWSPNGIAWVNSVGGHVSELYSAEGDTIRRVNIPGPTTPGGGLPTGIVFSGGQGFNLPNGPSAFLFTGFDGVLSGWNGASGDFAQRLKTPPGASYTGLAIGRSNGQNFIYGANFGKKKIDVWDTTFAFHSNFEFKDPGIPSDFSPYNIQAVGDWLFVNYAVLGADGHPAAGYSSGFTSVFKTDGSFVKRFASRGTLNVPWGVTEAPGSFFDDQDLNTEGNTGTGTDAAPNNQRDPKDPVILIGNFGDGRINVFTLDGRFLGQLRTHNQPLVIDGLWALSFAPTTSNVSQSRLYFTAGPDHENDGVFGYLFKQ